MVRANGQAAAVSDTQGGSQLVAASVAWVLTLQGRVVYSAPSRRAKSISAATMGQEKDKRSRRCWTSRRVRLG